MAPFKHNFFPLKIKGLVSFSTGNKMSMDFSKL